MIEAFDETLMGLKFVHSYTQSVSTEQVYWINNTLVAMDAQK